METTTLPDIITVWIKDHPDFKEHYSVTSNSVGSGGVNPQLIIHWIQCKCKERGALPPTPKYDMIILDEHISVWDMSERAEITRLHASSPTFFDDLEKRIKMSH